MKGILWYYTRLSGAAEPIFETSKWVAGLTKFQVPRLEIIQTGHARAIDHYILKYLTKVEDPEVSLNIVATFYSTTSTNTMQERASASKHWAQQVSTSQLSKNVKVFSNKSVSGG